MDCEVHAIGKAIRPRFADPVTYEQSYMGGAASIQPDKQLLNISSYNILSGSSS